MDLCVSAVTGAADAQPVAGADAQPQPTAPPQQPGGQDANLANNIIKPPTRNGQQLHSETSSDRDLPRRDVNDDDDAFMEPPPRQPVAKKQCINATSKLAKNPVKYAHAPTVRCAPSTFNSFVDHLTLWQRRQIKDMGFGGLLCVAAERLESRELLKFLFDRLDPKTMVLNVAKDKGIHVTPFVVKQVLDLPEGGEDIVLSTHIQASKALSAFKTLLGLQESHDLNASHLQKTLKDDLELGSGMITDDMAIRFFFIIACNKLLFPSTDNNIRCKDVYLTRDLSCLPALNWCKAVVDDLREAALNWQSDKAKKSFSGCAILLILRNIIDTCYHTTENPSSTTPPSIEPLPTTRIHSMQAELRGIVHQISAEPRKTQAMQALASFDAKAKEASRYVTIAQQMLSDAHQSATHILQAILNDEIHGNNSEDHDNQAHASDAGFNTKNITAHCHHIDLLFHHFPYTILLYAAQANDVDMNGHITHNVGSENVHTDVMIDHIVPHVPAKGDPVAPSPNGRDEENIQAATNKDDALGPILLQPCTQDEFIHRPAIAPRPQRLTKRPARYVSPFKGDPQRAKAPQLTAHAVRKKFRTDMKCKSDIFIRTGLREFSGLDIEESFLDGEMLSTQFMSYLVACMSYDECHMPDGGGYRVFLSQELGFLLPVMEEEHYTIYCINFIHDRIDVIDSSPDDHTDYHQVLGDRIIRRLNLLFQLVTDFEMKQFTRFKRPIIVPCMHTDDNDCGFYAIKSMELWNGDSFHVPILTVRLTTLTKTQGF
uniref:Ubiquitin-like protease family profile domain-containing protein n=1 Tax=Setaria italica TaxID=4555 RepID=K3Y165_SETIT